MTLLYAFILIPLAGVFLIPLLNERWKGLAALCLLTVNIVLTTLPAIKGLTGHSQDFTLAGSLATGEIPVRIDALSGWFILIINLVFLTGSLYGYFYLKSYRKRRNSLSLHYVSLLIQHAALTGICGIQNSFVFLVAWEILALSSFILIIFDHEKKVTIQAGINYLIQAHISIVFLMVGFIWAVNRTGSFDFQAIASYSTTISEPATVILFLVFFAAFAIKAGLVPFHTWLPYAHPAAPSHISGMMSGVIIKIGIYGILRMLLIIKTDYTAVGYLILIVSVLSGLYGVMLAIIQHNLKKLLAYHSIENIGIIGIGIGIGCIGTGTGNHLLAILGYTGALLHTLNHALFKSLLFYAAGNVFQSVHTMEIEKLGGIIKKMPATALMFLVAALAICGIPPFNGFISEFILYKGLYTWLSAGTLFSLLTAIFSTIALAAIGGLAIICFTKAFGIIFLGTERHPVPSHYHEVPFLQQVPAWLLVFCIILIGMFPVPFIHLLASPVGLFTGNTDVMRDLPDGGFTGTLQTISRATWVLVALILGIFYLRSRIIRKRSQLSGATWGCGYVAPTRKQQYTASSFVRSYSKLFGPALQVHKEEKIIQGVFPQSAHYHTHSSDKVEKWMIDPLINLYKSFMGRFVILQNGKLQVYILYGILFIMTVLAIPLIYKYIVSFLEIIKTL